MGIRMLHRRAAQALTRTRRDAGVLRLMPPPPVRVVADDASTARKPADMVAALRHGMTTFGGRLRRRDPVAPPPDDLARWRQWADLACGYLALVLDRLPRPRPRHTVTVFTAEAPPVRAPAGRDGAGFPGDTGFSVGPARLPGCLPPGPEPGRPGPPEWPRRPDAAA
ncbi:hypothetical protein [Streptomyces sp. NPDC008150]|uniref:hypothetical protein n=1 Tax=Streptomyces sp. NPDC008150 TaxID=3364816 RepID=UPI0036E7D829